MILEPAVLAGFEQLSDIELKLHAELDHRDFPFEHLINLRAGSVLLLGRPTGENIDVYVGEVLIAAGEILILESTLAICIADLKGKPSAAEGHPIAP
jgi:flagellar motor switch/type III secretory pathway protein FliN